MAGDAHVVVSLTKDRNYITVLPNFPSEIALLTLESWTFFTENFTDFSSDLMEKSGKFWTQIARVISRQKLIVCVNLATLE